MKDKKDRRNPAAVFCGFYSNQINHYGISLMVREMVNTHTIQIPCRKDRKIK